MARFVHGGKGPVAHAKKDGLRQTALEVDRLKRWVAGIVVVLVNAVVVGEGEEVWLSNVLEADQSEVGALGED